MYSTFELIFLFQILSIITMIYLLIKYKDKKSFKVWAVLWIIAVISNFMAEITTWSIKKW